MTSGAKSEGRFGKQDFVYMPDEDVYRCLAGENLKFYYANEEHGQKTRRRDERLQDLRNQGTVHHASRDGSMSTYSKPSSTGWIKILRPCAAGARR